MLKRLAARLPQEWQHELRKYRYASQIRRNTFVTDEPEFELVAKLIRPGDWVLDVGANIGHYTKRFSELTTAAGRVIAFEPVPVTFALLASNVRLFSNRNVTLFNAAASDRTQVVGMSIPSFSSGLTNYYEAHVSDGGMADLAVLTVAIDSLGITNPVSLVKIDAEGHETSVINGMRELVARDRPVLILENVSPDITAWLTGLGYRSERLPGSPNIVFQRA